MRRAISVLALIGVLLASFGEPISAQTPSESALYAVAYVDVMPSARGAMAGAFRQYRDASRSEEGAGRFELLEQVGRPGHFVVLEAWRDQKAAEAHAAAAPATGYQSALQPIRLSGYDQRPYKPLTVAPIRPGGVGQTVHIVAHVDIGGGGAGLTTATGLLTQLAEASRKEQGNLRFDVLQHATRANHFTVVESWQSMAALDAHSAAMHTRQYRETIQPMTGSPLDERVYLAVE